MSTRASFYYILPFLLLFGSVSGCTEQSSPETQPHQTFTPISSEIIVDQSLSNSVEKTLSKENDITKVRAVNTNKQLLVALKVSQTKRLKLEAITKRVTEKLKRKYPNYSLIVSSDYKLYLEVDRLETRIQNNKINQSVLKKEINKLKKLMREQT